MMEAGEVIVVKLGGAAGEDAAVLAALTAEIAALVARGAQLVLVHGGGGEVSELTRRLGLQPQFAAGVRVTSAAEMPYVDMVLCGAVNKRLVRACAAAGLRAVGLSGADGPIFTGVRLADEPGEQIFARSHTARVAAVDTRLLRLLLAAGYLPVVAPTSLEPPARPVNINADAVALRIASALAADRLLFLSDVPGVLKAGRVVVALTPDQAAAEIAAGAIHGGMIPKIEAAVHALEQGVKRVVIGRFLPTAAPGAAGGLAGLLTGAAGTTILAQSSPPTQLPIGGTAMQRNGAVVSDHPMPSVFTPELLVLDHGEGCRVQDVAGRSYLDFGGGIAVNALGYGREDLAAAAADQMRKLIHVSNLYATEPALALAEKLIASVPKRAGIAKVQFTNSGSEANETALKYARLLAQRGGKQGKHRIACFSGAFHGRTMGALSCTPSEKYQEPFAPLIPGITVLPYNDVDAARAALDDSFCAVIVEVVQGEGGLDVMSRPFAHALNQLCHRHAIMLIADEVQTGLSRTGVLYASALVGLEPDLITLAKPLGGGLPLAATLIPARIDAELHIGDHGTTFGGGPVTCAVGNVVWDIVAAPQFITTVQLRSRYLRGKLEQLAAGSSFLGQIKGAGLLTGVTVTGQVDGAPGIAKVVPALREAGLLALRSGDDVLRLAPPLVVSEAEIDEALDIVANVIADLAGAS